MSSVLLVKNWKEEPLSPITADDSNDEVTLFSENTFYQTCLDDDDDDNDNDSNNYSSNDVDGNIKLEDDLIPDEVKEEIASYMLEDIEKLIDLDELIKEEPYFLDEKILPMLDEVDPLEQIKLEYVRNQQLQPADNTQYLLNELDTVYVELRHETLTPPQSPPSQPVLTPLEPLLQQQTYPAINNEKQSDNVYPVPDDKQLLSLHEYRAIPPQQQQQLISMEYPIVTTTPQPDIAHELAVVDELVRTRVEDMQWNLNDSSDGPSSPTSNSCSGSSNFGDYSSDDPEWVPEAVENYNDGNPLKSPQQQQQLQRKRSKPYSRPSTVDKKSRKKEQNKNAATRYRMKKKAEAEVILDEEKQLLMKNEDLDSKINDMQREIKYLKGLMRDLFKAKGLIN